jgi:hypothetical protein
MINKSRFLMLFAVLLQATFSSVSYAASNSIVVVDNLGTVGQYTSMVLDSTNNPIISYYNATQAKLKVMHCFEKNCAKFNSIVTPDAASNVGKYTSIALDSNGNPVVSYYDEAGHALKVLHCGNSSCSTGNTIATPDSIDNVGQYTSITVDSNNKPVVSYYDVTKGILKVLHCGNAACNAGNTIATPDVMSSNGVQSSIKINGSGNPVVAYYDFTKKSLKMLTCGNASCTAGNTITTVDANGAVGPYPSLVLSNNGNPAVSYLDLTNGKLKILRCGNAMCTSGNTTASISSVSGVTGYFSSLKLDANNLPVVSFYNLTNGDLNIVRCGNASCTSSNTVVVPDAASQVGMYTSLRLDANNNPIVSYYDASNGDLKVLHCGSTTCNPNSVVVGDSTANVGQYSSIKLDSMGKPVVSYWDQTNGDLKLLHCGNANCTAGNSITKPDVIGNTGWDTSLQIDSIGNPVMSYFSNTDGAMKLLHCSNANCSGVNIAQKPDILSRRLTSMALDAAGNSVIASSGQADQGLRIVHCGDATCSFNNTITSPDFPAFPFNADVRGVSLALDANGFPVVSFYRADKGEFKILHCADAACNGPGNSIVIPDPGAQVGDHRASSLVLDILGNPVVTYQDTASNMLKVLHCGNANCTAGNTIASITTNANQPSIKLEASGNPIISFGSNSGMMVVHCGNTACTAGNTFSVIDGANNGWDSSLALDISGNPVVSYYNPTGQNLKVAHCGTALCQ